MSQSQFKPAYLLMGPDELAARAAALRQILSDCRLCPRECRLDRLAGETGTCAVGAEPIVSSSGPHFGEEAPLVAAHGSGTIFLTHCNLKCVFCQNYDISHLGHGTTLTVEGLADTMLDLQRRGCHNINWVTPTHQVPMLASAARLAAEKGLHLPIVYNCGGYESLEVIRLLDGIVDIYMPDAKYGDNETGLKLSGVPDYWDRNREALTEMHRQVGDLVLDDDGAATRGLLVRHLVLPNDLARTKSVTEFIASLSRDTYLNVMAQYRPAHRAREVPELVRPITTTEFRQAVHTALDAGLRRLDQRWAFL